MLNGLSWQKPIDFQFSVLQSWNSNRFLSTCFPCSFLPLFSCLCLAHMSWFLLLNTQNVIALLHLKSWNLHLTQTLCNCAINSCSYWCGKWCHRKLTGSLWNFQLSGWLQKREMWYCCKFTEWSNLVWLDRCKNEFPPNHLWMWGVLLPQFNWTLSWVWGWENHLGSCQMMKGHRRCKLCHFLCQRCW